MKKMIALALIVVFAALSLCACSGKTVTTVQATEVPAATEAPVVVTQPPVAEEPAELPAGETGAAEPAAETTGEPAE